METHTVSIRAPCLNRPECCLPLVALRCGATFGGLDACVTDRFGPTSSRQQVSLMGVRRAKAALSSGCKAHPAFAPAGRNRSGNGGNEMAEAFGYRRPHLIVICMVDAPSGRVVADTSTLARRCRHRVGASIPLLTFILLVSLSLQIAPSWRTHVSYPQLVDAGGGELALHQVWRRTPVLVALGRHAPPLASADAAQAVRTHHRSNAVVARLDPLVSEFGLDAWHAIGGIAGGVGLANLLQQSDVGLGSCAGRSIQPVVVAAVRDTQGLAHRTHGKFGLVRLHEFVDDVGVFSLLAANQAVAFARMSRSC